MYDSYLDISAGLIVVGFVLILLRLILARPIGWRDLSVIMMTSTSLVFWVLVAGRRMLDWPDEIVLLAFTLKFVSVYFVALHVWTQESGNVNRPEEITD